MCGEDLIKNISFIVASGSGRKRSSFLSQERYWKKALELLLLCKRPMIVTGFYAKERCSAETDGPMGAAILGRALKSLGKNVLLVTDWRCRGVVEAAPLPARGPKTLIASGGEQILRLRPDLLVFIKRPGKARDGRYYNMRGLDITDVTDPLDEAVSIARDAFENLKVIGVGDGGNEAGMGIFLQELVLSEPEFGKYFSVVKADAAIACDVSNWGAYGLVALMSCVTGRFLLHDEGGELQMIMAMLDAGAVDGKTLERSPFVSGLHLSKNQEVVSRLGLMVKETYL
jgi:hypothetical protein